MALALNTNYENVFYDVVLDGLRDILISEYNYGKIYISPKILYQDPFSIRLWGESAETEEFTIREWQKNYNVNINMYFIEQNPTEIFYKQIYQDSERVNQVIHNNQTKTVTVGGRDFTWLAAQVSDIEIITDNENEEDVKGLHTASLEFSCLVSRES
tara:strand:- start:850 stop:1320 length:471 start_codon:yes stop_codon:yes gene_type:complete